MQLALPIKGNMSGGLRLPPFLPPFNKRAQILFTLFWMVAFALALTGPLAGFYLRYTEAANNSQLLLGSRAGFAVSPSDATTIRFTVGPQAQKAGVIAGDRIVAIYGLPLPPRMSVDEATRIIVAYEPVWAIGTGRSASASQAQEVHAFLRARLVQKDASLARVALLYGGSVKPENAQALFGQADIDGGLIGGASLKSDDFLAICAAAILVIASPTAIRPDASGLISASGVRSPIAIASPRKV